ncbi:Dbl homology (DH) domain protein [Kalmanozyma brasiliensis GHG001]|uniref:Dbl homology (DH) domain protein n=1 Tax=Kalmanozyma brasiliensis (strain GHG001) TaxID=1365824 RepID=UPI002867C548|nr:Dbl homology (DH) domain protein [Kalmanozyma brasiliensis GHG001]EST08250.2 Dbl homology (DH) domain protein [Kalmanozyma brasiliensis GHG001]
MPPRSLPKSPFAGIGAGHSIVANLSRGSPAPSTPVRASHLASTSTTNTPTRYDGLPLADAHTNTFAAFSEADFLSSGVSDSLSRAFYFDVIVEPPLTSAVSSYSLSKTSSTTAFEAWLGDVVHDYDADPAAASAARDDDSPMPKSSSGSSITAVSSSSVASPGPSSPTKSSKVDPSKLFGRVQELIDTERSYVKRIDVLHQKYAVPLRDLAKDRTAAIIPLYEAQRLFGNIGEIAGANRAFLNDLERLVLQGHDALRAGLGEVIYNHMSCFSCYTDYFANFEKAKHIERTLAKHRAFCEFTDRTKYSVTDIGNTGLRDLMMEPVQRIPRYKLLIDAILKHVEQGDPLRKRLEQAISLVSRIASCEADEKTRRAAILWSFSRNIEAFPAELISAHRRFIDCIDVDDYPLDTSAGSSSIAASFSGIKSIPCTLFLFDDRIAIVKRSHASTSGRKLVGLDDVGRLISQMKTVTEKSSTGSILAPSKRSELSFRGCISLTDVEAQDLGGADLQLAMLRQPSHVTGDKWSNRPLRQYVAVDTSASAPGTHGSRIQMGSSSLDADVSAKLEKMRFLESVWKAKALYKAVRSRSEVRCTIVPASRRGARSNDILIGAPQPSLSLRDSRKVIYFQLHSRQSYADESHRAPVAVSVDPPGISDRVELGHTDLSHPHAILDISQVDEMEEEFVATVRTKSAHGGGEVLGEPHALSSADLADHIVQLSDEVEKRFGSVIRTHALSPPGTPSGSGFRQRAKAAAGLENFGRSLLFGGSGAASSISSAGISNIDVFGSPARRSDSNASKSTFSSTAASVSSRGKTMSTAGTSISSRSAALEGLSRGGTTNSPGSFRRFGRRRSSSVGPASSRCDMDSADENDVPRRTRAMTPDANMLLSTSAGAPASTLSRRNGTGTVIGGRGFVSHTRSRTESAAPSAPTWSGTTSQASSQQRQRADSVDLCRTPSSLSRRPTGPRGQMSPSPAPGSDHRAEPLSPSWMSNGSTTPLNIRRKAAPKENGAEDEDVATPVRARPLSCMGVYGKADQSDDGAPLVARRRASGTKRPLSSYDGDVAGNGGEGSLKKRPSHGLDKESKEIRLLPHKRPSVEEPGRSSISESEASTEQGHSKAPSQSVPPVAPARTSSTVTKAQESRRRNEAMEFGLRLVKEELNLLRCDVEILQSSLTAIENSRTPRKRPDSTVLADRDLNTTAVNREVTQIHARLQKLESLFTDVDARWISSIRMHNRIVHDLNVATTALASQAPTTTPAHEDALRSEKSKLEHQLSALKRQCELLTTLEADGRLENTEMHKAFNEELDLLYDHTQAPESIELAALRKELKRTKAAQHELMVENKRLKRDLTLEQGQTQTYKAALERHALL